jgi:hypothetical protein
MAESAESTEVSGSCVLRSHFSLAALAAPGVSIVSIESVALIRARSLLTNLGLTLAAGGVCQEKKDIKKIVGDH